MKSVVYGLIFMLAVPSFLVAQTEQVPVVEEDREPTGDELRADRLFFSENYKEAMKEYLMVLAKKPEDTKINYNLGLCYLNADFDKIKAVPYFEKVIFYDEEAANVYYLLAKAYQSDHQFDRAIDMFNRFLEFYGAGAEFSPEDAKTEIEYCENAYELMKFPVGVLYENLGPEINSEFTDYFPFTTLDESFIAFTSKRNDGSAKLPDGTYASNIYYTEVKNGEYTQAVPLPGAANNPAESEVVIGMSNDGAKLLLLKGLEGVSGDILEGEFHDGMLDNLTPLSERINSKYREIAATYGLDENTIYFVSDRPGGYGGTDIWIVKKLPTGAWAVPYNAGPYINTERDEDFPNVSPDGDFLFFSSKGHFSMGGHDIFKAKWNADSSMFMNPRNLGYPVNSVDDDMNYRQSKTGRYGYISSLRADGYGDYDLYRLTITEIESEYSVLKGQISSEVVGETVNEAEISVTDLSTGELFGAYKPNPKTMRYVIILPPGEFDVLVTAAGCEPVSFEVKILGKSSFQPEINKDLIMRKN